LRKLFTVLVVCKLSLHNDIYILPTRNASKRLQYKSMRFRAWVKTDKLKWMKMNIKCALILLVF
jgi:hypothetical protein